MHVASDRLDVPERQAGALHVRIAVANVRDLIYLGQVLEFLGECVEVGLGIWRHECVVHLAGTGRRGQRVVDAVHESEGGDDPDHGRDGSADRRP